MNNNDLFPCPFCGETPVNELTYGNKIRGKHIYEEKCCLIMCRECRYQFKDCVLSGSLEDAVKYCTTRWNRRNEQH